MKAILFIVCMTFIFLHASHATARTRDVTGAIYENTSDKDDVVWRSRRVCGINCLYILLRSIGIRPNYVVMQDALVKDELTSLQDMQREAAKYGVDLQLAKLTPADLRRVAMPIIVHGEEVTIRGMAGGHFLLLVAASDEGVTCIDGTTLLTKQYSWERFQRLWTGFAAYPKFATSYFSVNSLIAIIAGVLCGVILDSRRRAHDL